MSSYVAELCCWLFFGDFGAMLEVILCECVVSGIDNKGIQNKFLAGTDLTYGKVLDIARNLEIVA